MPVSSLTDVTIGLWEFLCQLSGQYFPVNKTDRFGSVTVFFIANLLGVKCGKAPDSPQYYFNSCMGSFDFRTSKVNDNLPLTKCFLTGRKDEGFCYNAGFAMEAAFSDQRRSV